MASPRASALQLVLTPNRPSTPMNQQRQQQPLSPMKKAFAVVACHLMRVYWIVASFVWPLICWIKSLRKGAKESGDQSAPSTRPPSRRRTPAATPTMVSIPLDPTDQALEQITVRRKPAALSIPPPYEPPKSFCPPISPPSTISSQETAPVCTPTVECNAPKSRFSLFRFKSGKSKKKTPSVAGSETTTPPPPDMSPFSPSTDGESPSIKPSKLGFMVRRRATEPMNAEAPPRPKPKKRFSGLGGFFGSSAPPEPPRRTNPYAAPYFCPTPDEVKRWELRERKDSTKSASDATPVQRSRPPISRPPVFKRTGSDGILFDPSMVKQSSRTTQCVRFVSGEVSDSGNQSDTLMMRTKSLRRITQRIPPRQSL